jgi:hypothetical protein
VSGLAVQRGVDVGHHFGQVDAVTGAVALIARLPHADKQFPIGVRFRQLLLMALREMFGVGVSPLDFANQPPGVLTEKVAYPLVRMRGAFQQRPQSTSNNRQPLFHAPSIAQPGGGRAYQRSPVRGRLADWLRSTHPHPERPGTPRHRISIPQP